MKLRCCSFQQWWGSALDLQGLGVIGGLQPQLAISVPTPSYDILGLPAAAAQVILLALTTVAFATVLRRRLLLLSRAAAEPRTGSWGGRIRRLLWIGFGQSRQPRYRVAGVVHIVLFLGFLILSLRSMSLLATAFWPSAIAFGGPWYGVVKDWTGLLVLISCAVAAWRRLVTKPARYNDRNAKNVHTKEAVTILALIALLMVADGFFSASQFLLISNPHNQSAELSMHLLAASEPLATMASSVLPNDLTVLTSIHVFSFWLHNIVLLFFLCLLPIGKHFHVITALPNVFLSNLRRSGWLKPPSYSETDFDALESVGVSKLEDFTWKQLLDVYSCVDCGRCSDHCPAYATATPLSPRMLSIKTREAAYRDYPIRGPIQTPEQRPKLVGETIREEELWACTTCGACEEACPVMIEYIGRIVDMRRSLVDHGNLPASLQKPMAALEKRGNPYGKMARKRGDWAKEVGSELDGEATSGINLMQAGDKCDALFFTDSCAAFDPRVQQTAVAFGNIMCQAGVDVGTLGKDEVDSGNEARRFGEEGLFLALREQNMQAFGQREFQRIVTTDPHAMNGLCHDYELQQPVLHHSQVLATLLHTGKLPLQPLNDTRRYAFHDPCYLGRHNGEYDAPREVLNSIPGIQTVEMKRNRNRSFCCGGGSLNLFHESECEVRMGEMRLDQAADVGAQVIVTACPYCLVNLEDAVKTSGREQHMEIIDLAELVQRSIAGSHPDDPGSVDLETSK